MFIAAFDILSMLHDQMNTIINTVSTADDSVYILSLSTSQRDEHNNQHGKYTRRLCSYAVAIDDLSVLHDEMNTINNVLGTAYNSVYVAIRNSEKVSSLLANEGLGNYDSCDYALFYG